MLRVSKRAAGACAIEDTEYMASKMTNHCDLCQLHLFFDIVKLQYVGTETYDTHRMLNDIYLALSDLNLVSKVNGKSISLTLDTLYQRFIEFSPLLPPNATSCSFSLVTLFYNALKVELQEAIRINGYILPNNSNLTTLLSKIFTLQVMRENLLWPSGFCLRRKNEYFRC